MILFFYLPLCVFGQQPVADFSSQNTTGCFPVTIRFTNQSAGSPVSYKWDLGNGTISALPNPVTTYFTPGDYNVTLTVTSASGSNTITKSKYIKVSGKPAANFSANDSVGCAPLVTNFYDLSNGSGGITSWNWNFGDGDTSNQQQPSHTYPEGGTFDITLTVTNAGGCSNTLTRRQLVKVFQPPTAAFDFTSGILCKTPATINFSNQSSGNTPLKYFWDFGDGNSSTQLSPANIYTTAGIFPVKLIVLDNAGCSDTLIKKDSLQIKNISSFISSNDSVCVGSNTTVSGSFSQTPSSVKWCFGDSTYADGVIAKKTWTTPGLYTITVLGLYPGCSDSTTKTIKVLSLPNVSFGVSGKNSCRVPFGVQFSDSTPGTVKWNWELGDGNTSTIQNPQHTYSGFGKYTVKLTATNSAGCSNSITSDSLIKALKPVAKIANVPAGGCIPFTYNFVSGSTSPDGIASYAWSLGNGDTSTSASPSATYLSTGAYTIKLMITTKDGCKDSVTVINGLKSGTKPTVDFAASPLSQCFGQPVLFKDLSVGSIEKWLWSTGDNTSSTQKNFQYVYKDTGNFTVKLIAWQNGCSDTLTKKNYITLKVPVAKFKINYNCANRPDVSFKDQSVSATRWLWDFGDGGTSSEQNPVHIFVPNKTYTIKLTVGNDTCNNSVTKTISVAGLIPSFAPVKTPVCQSDSVGFTIINNTLSNKYSWSFGDSSATNSTAGTVFHKYTTGGKYTITLFAEDVNGCRDTIVKPNVVEVFAPKANFGISSFSGCSPAAISLTNNSITANNINNIASAKWFFGDGQTFTQYPANNGITHTYSDTGSYQPLLEITDSIGCSDRFSLPKTLYISKPKAAFNGSYINTCSSNSVQLINTSEGKSLKSNWLFSDGTSSNTAEPFKSFIAEGDYSTKLIVTDSFGCTDSIEKINYFRVKNPVASFVPDDSTGTCVPFKVTFTNSSRETFGQVWNFGDGSSSTLTNPVHFFDEPGTYNVKIVVKRSTGCLDSVFKKIQINIPAGSINYNSADGCAPASISFRVKTGAGVSYLYDFDDGTSVQSSDSTIKHQYSIPGAFLPKVVLKDSLGCLIPVFGADSLRIYNSTADFNAGRTLFCDSGTVAFSNLSASGNTISSYNWNFGDGTSSTLKNPVHHYTTAGLFDVSLNIKNITGCTDSIIKQKLIYIAEKPRFNIAGVTSFCGPSTVSLSANLLSPTVDTLKWKWSFSNGSSSTLMNAPPQFYGSTGNYPVQLIAISNQGCTDTAKTVININSFPIVNAGAAMTAICQGGTSAALGGSFGGGATSAIWSATSGIFANNTGSTPGTATFTAEANSTSSITLTLTTSGGSCGTTSTSKTIVVNPNPTVDAGGAMTAICQGGTSAALSGSFGGGETSAVWSDGGAGGSFTNNAGGTPNIATYTASALSGTPVILTLTTSGGSCGTTSTSKTIVVNPNPTVNAGGAMTAICQGGTSTALGGSIGGGATSAIWSDGGAGGSFTNNAGGTPNIATYIASASSGTPVTLTLTTSVGSCGTTSTGKTIVVNPNPTVNAGGAMAAICQGGTSAALGGSIGGGATSAIWSATSGTFANNTGSTPGTATFTAAANSTSPITLTLTTTGGSCATTSTSKTIVVNPNPTVNAGGAMTAICQGGTSAALGGSFGGGATSAVWSAPSGTFANNTGSTPGTATFTAAANSTSPITLTLTTSGGSCGTTSTSKTIVVNPNPTVNAGGAMTAICQGGTSAALGGSFGGGATSAIWSAPSGTFANNTGSTPGNATFTAATNSTSPITLTLTTGGGSCATTSTSKTIVVNPNPTVNAGGAMTAICQGGTSAALGGSFGGGATSAVWSASSGTFANNTGSTPGTATFTDAANSTSPITLTLTTSGGSCGTTSTSKTIVVNPNPTVNAGGAMTAICQGGTSAALGGSFGGGETSAVWSDGGAGGSFTNNAGGTPNTAAYIPSASSGTLVTLTLTTSGGSCGTTSTSKTIVVNPNPTLNAGGAMTAICQGGTSAALGGSIGGAATSAIWSDGGAGGSFTNNAGVTPNTATYIASASSGNPVTLTLTTSGGSCGTTSTSKTIVINPNPKVNAGKDTLICLNTSAVLHATGADSYEWSPSTSVNCNDCSNPITTITDNTTFILTGTTTTGCKRADTIVVTVKKPFTLISPISVDSICAGETTPLSVTGAENYSWSPPTGLSSITAPNPLAAPGVSTIYKVVAFDNNRCFSDSAFINVKVFSYPRVDAGQDLQTSFGQAIKIVTSTSPDVVKWEWSPGQTLSCIDCASPSATPVMNTTYKVKVTSAAGCTSTDEVQVMLTCDRNIMFLPTAFTPNNDNLNDVFYPRSIGVFKIKSFRIFNRKGELVFINASFPPNIRSNGWDGSFKGRPADAGNYLYSIDIICNNNEELSFTGNILLLH